MPQDPPARDAAPGPKRGRPPGPGAGNRTPKRGDDPKPDPRPHEAAGEPGEEGRIDELQARWRRYGLAEGMRAKAEPSPPKPAPAPKKRPAEHHDERPTRAAPPPPRLPGSAASGAGDETSVPNPEVLKDLLRRLAEIERAAAARVDALERASDEVVQAVEERARSVQSELEQTGDEQVARLSDLVVDASEVESRLAELQRVPDESGREAAADDATKAARADLASSPAATQAELDERANRALSEIDEMCTITRTGVAADLATMRSESEAIAEDVRAQRARLLETAASARSDLDQFGIEQLARLSELVNRVAATEQAPARLAGSLEAATATQLRELEESASAAGARNIEALHQAGVRQADALGAVVAEHVRALEGATTAQHAALEEILDRKVDAFETRASDVRAELERISTEQAVRFENAIARFAAAELRATELVGELLHTGATQSQTLDDQADALTTRLERAGAVERERLQQLIERAADLKGADEIGERAPSRATLDVSSIERMTEFSTGGALEELISAQIVEVEQICAAQVRALEEMGAAQSRVLTQAAAVTSAAQAQAFEQAAEAAISTQASVLEQAATAMNMTQTRMLESTAAAARVELERLSEAQVVELQELAVWIEQHEQAAASRVSELEARSRQIYEATGERLGELERTGIERAQMLEELAARVEVIERGAASKVAELQALIGVARLEDRRGGPEGTREGAGGTEGRAGERGDT